MQKGENRGHCNTLDNNKHFLKVSLDNKSYGYSMNIFAFVRNVQTFEKLGCPESRLDEG